MAVNKTKKAGYIKRDYSKTPPINMIWGKDGPTVYPDFSYDLLLDSIEADPVARGAINHFVDKCMEGEYAVVRREDRTYDWGAEMLLEEKYMFRTKLLRRIFYLGKLYNNVFLEIVRFTDGKVKYLNVLDTRNIEPILDANGDPVSYVAKYINKETGKYATWTKDEITWIKFNDRGTGFAPADIKTLLENLSIKYYIKRYVAWLWKTGQYRLVYNFESASNQDINDFLAYARKNDGNFHVPFILKGKFKTQLLRDMKETSSLIELLSYLDSQTLILLRVPPIDAGIPDASGRSSSDAQANSLETSVTSFKKIVEDYINFDLFQKINKSTYLLQFGPMNRLAEQMVMNIAQTMSSMNFKDEVVKEYLLDKGIFYGGEDLFKEPEDLMMAAGGPANPRDKDNMPSRKAKAEGEGNKPQAQVTTREDQLHSNR
jgi:hypothetical protein